MPREFNRNDRVADFVKRELAQVLQQEMRDPRTVSTNVNDVVVTRDLSLAKVYVTFLDKPDDETEAAVAALNKAAGFLRSQLAARNTMRSTPRLMFYYDETVRTSEHLSKLIAKAVESDSAERSDNAE